MEPTPIEIARSTDWFPDTIDFARNTFSFVRTTRETLSQQSFLDSRWDRTRLQRINTPIPTIVAATKSEPTPQLNIIWHTAFCCSTLLSRCLDVPGTNLALKEPQILILLAEAKRAGHLAQHETALDSTLKLLARPRATGERVLLKPTNAVNNLVPEISRATDGKMLLLYSDCKNFLISIAKKGEMGRIFTRKLFSLFAADGHPQSQWPAQDLFELSDLQIAAIVWHMQIAQLRRAIAPSRTAALDCEDFLAHPEHILSQLNDFFGLELPAKINEIVSGPHLSINAKNQNEPFSAERRAREAESVAKSFGTDLDTVVEWSYRACPQTPRENPLGPTLGP